MYTKRQLARKTIARKAHEPRRTLKPQWNIIENGTVTNYSLHNNTRHRKSKKHGFKKKCSSNSNTTTANTPKANLTTQKTDTNGSM